MKRFLMRGAFSPAQPADKDYISNILLYDTLGSNSGNLLYANGVFRSLYGEDVTIDIDQYKGERWQFNDADAARINEEYDGYIITLADAFRPDFIDKLNSYTALLKKLTIPCYLIGAGIRAPYGYDPKEGFSFDSDVKKFISAVLDHSAMVGLRGETTANYLAHLGFVPEKDFTAIGCPSLFTFGRHLTVRDCNLTKDSKIAINFGESLPVSLQEKMQDLTSAYPNTEFVGQSIQEFLTLYLGQPNKKAPSCFPITLGHSMYESGRAKCYITPQTWMDDMKSADLSIGVRFHGNVAPVLAGTPTLFLPWDARTQELVAYHNLPSMPMSEFMESGKPLEELVADVDFASHLKTHNDRFAHYLDFLHTNGIPSVFDADPDRKELPLDKISVDNEHTLYKPAAACDKEELLARLPFNYQAMVELQTKYKNGNKNKAREEKEGRIAAEKRCKKLENELAAKNASVATLEKKLADQEKLLNRKVVRLSLKTADGVGKAVRIFRKK